MPKDLRDIIAAEVRAEMARQRLTQQGLADRMGERQWWVSKRLTRSIPFTIEDLERVAKALGVPVTRLMPETERAA